MGGGLASLLLLGRGKPLLQVSQPLVSGWLLVRGGFPLAFLARVLLGY